MSVAPGTLKCGHQLTAGESRIGGHRSCRSRISDSPARVDDGGRQGERTPPHDLLAEQSALGGMLLSKDAVADVIETVRGVDFYVPKHEVIFDAILSLYSHGEPTDVIAVTDELTKTGELQRAGGAEYLHTLTAHRADRGERRLLRVDRRRARAAAPPRRGRHAHRADGLRGRGRGHSTSSTTPRPRSTASPGPIESEDYVPLTEAVDAAVDEIEAARGRDGQMTGVPTGFAELDELTNGLHPGQMIIVAARPAIGKSTLALDFARAAAIKHDLPTIFFSLEMGRSEIAMRLLARRGIRAAADRCARARSTPRDWTTIASTRGRINDAPLYIDDSPNMTLVEIRAKCRRLKQRVGLKMVVIDYLQLMTSGKRVESRQQEVASSRVRSSCSRRSCRCRSSRCRS